VLRKGHNVPTRMAPLSFTPAARLIVSIIAHSGSRTPTSMDASPSTLSGSACARPGDNLAAPVTAAHSPYTSPRTMEAACAAAITRRSVLLGGLFPRDATAVKHALATLGAEPEVLMRFLDLGKRHGGETGESRSACRATTLPQAVCELRQ
jgi:hypothetical protein